MFFVDEIHRLPRALEETFYPAMEDGVLPITVGQGAGARVVTLPLPPFTLIGATTRDRAADHAAARPLRDPAPPRALRARGPGADRDALGAAAAASRSRTAGAVAIARRSRGTPRVANRLLQARARLRRGAPRGRGHRRGGGGARSTCSRSTRRASTAWTARSCGAICEKFGGGPVGLSTLAVAVGEERDTIEDVYEPYLLQRGLIERTPRGRAATRRAYAHLGLRAAPAARPGCSRPGVTRARRGTGAGRTARFFELFLSACLYPHRR